MEFNPPPFPGAQPPMPEPEKTSKRKRRKGEPGDTQVTKKVVSRQRNLALMFAGLVAIVAAVAFFGAQPSTTYVVEAAKDVDAGVPLSVKTHLVAKPVPDEFIEDGAITGTSEEAALSFAESELDGRRVQYPLRAGEQIHDDMFNVELTLSTPLEDGERLVSINVNISHAVAAQIKAGDRVDIHATADGVGAVIASNVEVVSKTVAESQYQALATQQAGESKNAKAEELLPGDAIPGIYVLRVDAEDAVKLATANVTADLTLLYRGEGETDLDVGPQTAKSIVCGNAPILNECQS